jgi:hypothetical protein
MYLHILVVLSKKKKIRNKNRDDLTYIVTTVTWECENNNSFNKSIG